MKTFNFDTGVRVSNNPQGPKGGKLSPNGVWVIPFEVTEDVPAHSELEYLCSSLDAGGEYLMRPSCRA